MFARSISFRLQPDSVVAFTKLIENETLPLLRKQKGFKDEITLVAPGGREAVGISLWDSRESAEAYNSQGYPEVLKTLRNLVEGTPQVTTYEVANSTLHKIAARSGAA
jgi:heme-degrading monooxygenase HmoA